MKKKKQQQQRRVYSNTSNKENKMFIDLYIPALGQTYKHELSHLQNVILL